MGEPAYKLDTKRRMDTRHAPRADVYVSMDVFSDHNFWTGLSMNMSESGVFVATHQRLPVGSLVVIHVLLPHEEDPLVVTAKVCWSRAYVEGQDAIPPGLGLQFVELDDRALLAVRRFVDSVREPMFYEA